MKTRIVWVLALVALAAGMLACGGLDAPKIPPHTGTTIHPTAADKKK